MENLLNIIIVIKYNIIYVYSFFILIKNKETNNNDKKKCYITENIL